MTELTSEQKVEVKNLRKEIKRYSNLLNKNKAPENIHYCLENIISLYNKLYFIDKPSLSDKSGFLLLKTQYKVVCALIGKKPNKILLGGDRNA